MTDDTTATVLAVLRTIAPEIEPGSVALGVPLADQLDLDSMDLQRFLAALAARYQVDIPDTAIPQLATVAQIAAYLEAHHAPPPR